MELIRSSGILLHPTSLPGAFGIGDIGPTARRWIDFLAKSRCSIWQILPLGPTGYGDSPYQCFSAFAGNPYLISPEVLLEEDLLLPEDIIGVSDFSEGTVNFGSVIPWKLSLLDKAFIRFRYSASLDIQTEYADFRTNHRDWLEDFALFMAIKEDNGGNPWISWESKIRNRDSAALEKVRNKLEIDINRHVFRQFIFFRQWKELHEYARKKGITIIGDVPIFVAHDSADVWANKDFFYLRRNGHPSVVAGVPPDYFSPTGQLWGNPLYRWQTLREQNYAWWVDRLSHQFEIFDMVRLDHFRGFVGYWAVPGNAKTAENGRWITAPGFDFLSHIREKFGDLPIIAEDLGVITPDVIELRDRFDLPGMKILQFGFESGPKDAFLPHHYPKHCVAYTGTHDNDTARGWFERVTPDHRDFFSRYAGRELGNAAWDMIQICWASVADFTLAPMQDFLSLGNEARMNFPGIPNGNWVWRMKENDLSDSLIEKIQEINYLYDRENPYIISQTEQS